MRIQTDTQVLEGATMVLLTIEKDAEARKQLAIFGLTNKRYQDGKNLLAKANTFKEAKTSLYDDQWELGQALNAELETTRALFKDHVVVARTAFRHNKVVLRSLKVKSLSTKTWDWISQALHFYTKVEPHIDAMAPHGVTAEIIAQAKASVEALLDMKSTRLLKKGQSEASTVQKTKAIKALKAWLVEFRAIARLAFKDNSQMLEAFGIKVPSKV